MEYTVSIIEELFPGFYNTEYDPDNIERYDNNDELEELSEERYRDIVDNFCEYIVDLVNTHSPFKVIRWRLDSPTNYNYRNDIIWVTIDTTPEKILFEAINHEDSNAIFFDTIPWDMWHDNQYHDAILEQLIAYPLFEFRDTFIEQLY